MTRLGYGEEIRRWRVKKHKEHDRLLYARYSNITVITAGSKAEGLTCFLESDWDVLNALNSILCVEAGINLQTLPDDVDLFKMDTRVYPGHCRLFLDGQALRSPKAIINSLCDNGYGDVLLSSSLLLDEYSPRLFRPPTHLSVVHHERAGPSLPESIAGIHLDMVPSLRCHCPSILQRWAARPRHWPSPVIVQKVVSLGAYLTPVGCKNSEAKHMEWRICFNTGESELVNNLNDTQAKVYVILKMILKDLIKPHKKEIASYC
ncbi:hypothetical protein DPMN_092501 [Dreissena polymorpha]|uniref:Mab-21-like nucleotidyltransferase domain-containing protein n=1 Tax=Dreissena polymorpha TaxID=45954 RepID=A0A9D4R1R2_DREPO|nr:hypothetical protein DPMN_092501 [Dreissena polymorpha]